MCLALDNPNMETSDIWILGSETEKKMRFAHDNPNTEIVDNVGSFRIWILDS